MDDVAARLAAARVGRLATVGEDGGLRLVPICFAVVAGRLVSAVDHKPKTTLRLARLRDIRATGRAVVLVDHYEEDWGRLWWIRVTGTAVVHEPGDAVDALARGALAQKYEQYRQEPPVGPVWSVTLDEVATWSAGG